MRQEVRVLIIGESPMVEGIVIGLEHDPLIKLQQVRADQYDTLPISDFRPTAIVYDRGHPQIEEILGQAWFLPGMRLIGVDVYSDHVLVMDSQLLAAPDMKCLRRLIVAATAGDTGAPAVIQPVGRRIQSALEIEVAGLDR